MTTQQKRVPTKPIETLTYAVLIITHLWTFAKREQKAVQEMHEMDAYYYTRSLEEAQLLY